MYQILDYNIYSFNRIEIIYIILICCTKMQTQESQFTELLNSDNNNISHSVLLTREQITEIVGIYSAPCPNTSAGARQRFYWIRKKYSVKHTQSCQILSTTAPDSSTLLRVLAKEELFDIFSRLHCEGGKNLGEIA